MHGGANDSSRGLSIYIYRDSFHHLSRARDVRARVAKQVPYLKNKSKNEAIIRHAVLILRRSSGTYCATFLGQQDSFLGQWAKVQQLSAGATTARLHVCVILQHHFINLACFGGATKVRRSPSVSVFL